MVMHSMKEMDIVEIIVEKKEYTDEGVHKGMQGWICLDVCTDGYWVVNLPQYGAKPDIATLSVHQDDMILIPCMDARTNERIRAEHEGK